MKEYLLEVWLGLDTSLTSIRAQVVVAACFDCLTPRQQETLQTYLLALSAGAGTDVSGVRAIEVAAKCFDCPESKRLYEIQVYILSILSNVSSTVPSDIVAASKCFISCLPPGIEETLLSSLVTQTAGRLTGPCVTPTAPTLAGLTNSVTDGTILQASWKQLANTGSLITSYTVFWGTVSGVYTNQSAILPAAPKQYLITGLTPGTLYFVAVQANSSASSACKSVNSNERSNTTGGVPPIDPAVTAWEARVIANGGADPSAATLSAANTFWTGIKADGLDSLIIALNFIAPDSLTAALVPFIRGPGNDIWTNNGPLLNADIGVGGLDATSGTKYLQLGITGTTAWSTDNDYGMSVYGRGSGANVPNFLCDLQNGGTSAEGLYYNRTDMCWGTFGFQEWSTPVVLTVNLYHFVTITRTAVNAAAAYHANGVEAFSTLGTTAVAPSPRLNYDMPMNARNINNGTFGLIATNFYSFFCIHHGLTLAQSQALFNRVQTLRTALGGGFS
jgi:hypothetical protein